MWMVHARSTTHPVKQLAVHHVRFLPRRWKHSLEVNFLVTVRTGLFLPHNAPCIEVKTGSKYSSSPATDAEFMELVSASEPEGVLNNPVLVRRYQQLVGTH